jgi:hypothetical protein
MTCEDPIDGASPAVPEGMADALERLDQYGGFLVLQRVETDEYAVLLGGFCQVLWREAKVSADRSFDAFQRQDFSAEAGAAASTILCCAASCEARLSEYLAHYECIAGALPTELESIRQQANAREQWRELLRFSAPTFKLEESREYLALGCLYRVRDLVAHRSARLAMPGALPSTVIDCVRQGTMPIREPKDRDWTSALFVYEVARWSVDVAERWLELVDSKTPIHC